MFNIGDKIFYPMHGAGIIENIENKEILGETVSYYIIKLPGEVTVMAPANNASNLGLRDIISEDYANNIVNTILEPNFETNENWAERYNDNKEKLKTGDIQEAAEIFKTLSYRNLKKNLSTSEKKMLSNTKKILFSELVASTNKSYDELETLFNNEFENIYNQELLEQEELQSINENNLDNVLFKEIKE